MGDGYFGAGCFFDYKRDYGPGIENYECDGCRNDGFVHTGCGCGGHYDKFHAEVPIDMDVEKGEIFNDFKPWMSNVEEGWV